MPRKNAEPKGPPETVDLLDSDDDEPVVVNGKRLRAAQSRRIADKPGEEKQMLTPLKAKESVTLTFGDLRRLVPKTGFKPACFSDDQLLLNDSPSISTFGGC